MDNLSRQPRANFRQSYRFLAFWPIILAKTKTLLPETTIFCLFLSSLFTAFIFLAIMV